jgi:tRNA(fMet)-specific endonuclease VapC
LNGWLFDTNVLIDLVFGRHAALSRRYIEAVAAASALYVSSVSVFEFRFGAERSRRREFHLEALRRMLEPATVIDFDQEDAEVAAVVKSALATQGTPMGPYDLLIASQALSRDLAVATGNTREFARVAGLSVEDWRTGPD